MHALRDTLLIFRRSLILTLRQPVWIFFGLMQPILYLALFGPLLDGADLRARTLTLARPSLDDVFLRQTGRSLREEPAA